MVGSSSIVKSLVVVATTSGLYPRGVAALLRISSTTSNRTPTSLTRMHVSSLSRPVTATPGSNNNEQNAEPSFAWCSCASIKSDGSVSIQKVTGFVGNTNNKDWEDLSFRQPVPNRILDVTRSGDWMEYLEHQDERMNDEGGAGAYDTMRCDILLHNSDFPEVIQSGSERVWGENFHLNRLQNSYLSLLHEKQSDKTTSNNLDDSIKPCKDQAIVEALDESRTLLRRLFLEAESDMAQIPHCDMSLVDDEGKTTSKPTSTYIRLVRLTILWSPPLSSQSNDGINNKKIVVRAHACSSCKPVMIHTSPTPIVVTIAAHTTKNNNQEQQKLSIDESLPTRFHNPHAKIASWCRLRRKMENKETYMPSGVSEVLMVRKRQDDDDRQERLEVLEGLSSNVFAIYKDGTLRTAMEGVLHGYVRHLVLEATKDCGLKFDPQPIYLDQANDWEEVFITSSSRLIYPISKILIPSENQENDIHQNLPLNSKTDGTRFTEYWVDPILVDDQVPKVGQPLEAKIPKWQQLLNSLLCEGGY